MTFLKTSKRVAHAARATGIPEEYLKVLRREVGGYQPKPLRLAEFKSLSIAQTAALQAAGIKTSFDLLREGASKAGRAALAAQTGLPVALILELVQMSDLCRVLGVGDCVCGGISGSRGDFGGRDRDPAAGVDAGKNVGGVRKKGARRSADHDE